VSCRKSDTIAITCNFELDVGTDGPKVSCKNGAEEIDQLRERERACMRRRECVCTRACARARERESERERERKKEKEKVCVRA